MQVRYLSFRVIEQNDRKAVQKNGQHKWKYAWETSMLKIRNKDQVLNEVQFNGPLIYLNHVWINVFF